MKVEISTNSYSEQVELICKNCDSVFSADIWRIVDVAEQPFLEDLVEGRLHKLICSKCNSIVKQANVPFLLYGRSLTPPLIFASLNTITEEENLDEAFKLISILKTRLGENWSDEWASQITKIPIQFLPKVLAEWVAMLLSKLINNQEQHPKSTSENAISELEIILQEIFQPSMETAMHIAPVKLASIPHRIELCERALSLMNREQTPEVWGILQAELGSSLFQNPMGNLSDNLEQALFAYNHALQIFSYEFNPKAWVLVMVGLVSVYGKRLKGNPADNLEKALNISKQILEKCSREIMPVEWAQVMTNLANIYFLRIEGNKEKNKHLALETYKKALEVRTREGSPMEWALTMGNLANVYACLEDKKEGIEQAIECYLQVLEVLTYESSPIDYGRNLMNLGNAYSERIQGDKAKNIEKAMDVYEKAFKVYIQENIPLPWVQMMNLADFYSNRTKGDEAENIEKAIDVYKNLLQGCTRESMPQEWARTTVMLANAYIKRMRREEKENLHEALELCQQAVLVYTREGMPVDWARMMLVSATIYSELGQNNKIENSERVIELSLLALEVLNPKATLEEWIQVMNLLVDTYIACIKRNKNRTENIERAIEACNQQLLVQTRELMPKEWASIMIKLADIYFERVTERRVDNLEKSIEIYEQMLQVCTREAMPEDWAQIMMNLANTYCLRIKEDRSGNIERAIEIYEQALQVCTREAMPEDWAQIMMNITMAYFKRILGDKGKNLKKALEACENALQIYTKETNPVKWAVTKMNMAAIYTESVTKDRASNIELAIEIYKQALQSLTCDANPREWSLAMMNLGNAYSYRFSGDRVDNLEKSIKAFRHALQVCTRESMPIEWAQTMMNLALVYSKRIQGNILENTRQAIEIYDQILQFYLQESMFIEWAQIMASLGMAYRNSIDGNRAENIEKAIKAYEQALAVYRRESMMVEWGQTMMNLANAYSNRIEGDPLENLEKSIEAHRNGLQVHTREAMPIRWAVATGNLALTYCLREEGGRAKNTEEAVRNFNLALEILTPDSLPNDCRRVASSLADLFFQEGNWGEAVIAYEKAIVAADNLYKASILRYSKEVELIENRNLHHLAAYSFARIGNLKKAVVTLERAKARRLSEILERERIDLEQVKKEYPDVYKRYQDAAVGLRGLENEELNRHTISSERRQLLTSEELREWASKAKRDLDAAIEEIRTIPGYEDFLTQPDFEDIKKAVHPGSPLVYLVTTPAGSLTLIVNTTYGFTENGEVEIESIWSDSFALLNLIEMLDNWFNTYEKRKQVNKETPDKEKEQIQKFWLGTIEKTTKALWKDLMGEVTQCLLQMNAQQAVLIPMGHLALLPLHSAWTELDGKRHYVLDDIAFTYAPSAVALSHSRQIAEKVSSQQLLAVVEPKPVNEEALPNANIEVDSIEALFESSDIFKHEDATRSAVLEKLPEADIVHFSCHGETNLQEPLKSGLLMAENEMITAGDLFQLGLKGARMATLSACETGIVGLNLPDESIGLPAAFLQAGFAGVVASLWLVDDLSTAMLIERFYQLWQREGVCPAQALQKAQQWLRDTTKKEKEEYFGKDLSYIFSASAVRMSGMAQAGFYDKLSLNLTNECNFEHPFYWAAFSLTGI